MKKITVCYLAGCALPAAMLLGACTQTATPTAEQPAHSR